MTTMFKVQNMTCDHCARHVTDAVHSVDAAARVKIDLSSGKVEVSPNPSEPATIAKAITEAGYPAQLVA